MREILELHMTLLNQYHAAMITPTTHNVEVFIQASLNCKLCWLLPLAEVFALLWVTAFLLLVCFSQQLNIYQLPTPYLDADCAFMLS
jgi:hypothetical protein